MPPVFIVTTGSRGDCDPLVSLALALATFNFTPIHFFHQTDHAYLIPPSTHIIPHTLPFSTDDLVSLRQVPASHSPSTSSQTLPSDPFKRALPFLAKVVAAAVIPALHTVLTAARSAFPPPAVVICTTFSSVLGRTVSDALGIPFVLVHFQPNVPTRFFPHHLLDLPSAKLAAHLAHSTNSSLLNNDGAESIPEDHRESYRQVTVALHDVALPALNAKRDALSLAPLTPADICALHAGTAPRSIVITSFPQALAPPPADWDEIMNGDDRFNSVVAVPPFSRSAHYSIYSESATTVETEVYNFLDSAPTGHPSLCVTLGSMRLGDAERSTVTRELLRGMRAAGVTHALVQTGTRSVHPDALSTHHATGEAVDPTEDDAERSYNDIDRELLEWAARHVLFVEHALPHDAVLPRCGALLCHGGAGTLAAGLRAGVGIVAAPVAVDQFFWAECVERAGVGAAVRPSLKEADGAEIARALRAVLGVQRVSRKVRKVAEDMRKEVDGCARAVLAIDRLMRRENAS